MNASRSLGRRAARPSNSRYQTSSSVRSLGELDGGVLAVVVEALVPADVADSVSATTTPLRPRGTCGGSMAVVAGMGQSAAADAVYQH